jgi:acyl-CoA reductase-like NAD-dependent aldehyde dehydrogenase
VVRALLFGTRLNAGETCIAPRRLIIVESAVDELRSRLLAARVPSLPIERVRNEEEAVAILNASEYALGASIFSRDTAKARALAGRIKTGFVIINDLIVPTADPRMPFGGVKASGFGSTRGAEGLLGMTFPHVVAVRHGRHHPHFDEAVPDDVPLFTAYIRAAHGRSRFPASRDFLGALIHKIRTYKKT